jgi:hypothetical protein
MVFGVGFPGCKKQSSIPYSWVYAVSAETVEITLKTIGVAGPRNRCEPLIHFLEFRTILYCELLRNR